MLVSMIVGTDAMNIGTLVSRMVSEWHCCIHTKRMDVSIVDFMNHIAFQISVLNFKVYKLNLLNGPE